MLLEMARECIGLKKEGNSMKYSNLNRPDKEKGTVLVRKSDKTLLQFTYIEFL
jgi:hypothetical protein